MGRVHGLGQSEWRGTADGCVGRNDADANSDTYSRSERYCPTNVDAHTPACADGYVASNAGAKTDRTTETGTHKETQAGADKEAKINANEKA